jgi:glycerophosphoryl diester phosphodiesterase
VNDVAPWRPLVLAHRGASADRRENTLEAFVLAAEQGADGVELDVRKGRDGALLVHHDAHLPDGTPLDRVGEADRPAWLPTLAEALATTAGLMVNVEIKNDANEDGFDPARDIAAAVAAATVALRPAEEIVISSFDRASIDRVRREVPPLRTAFLTLDVPDAEALVADLRAAGHHALNPWYRNVNGVLMEAARSAGIAVMPWTVDEPAEQRRLATLRVDAIITNVPTIALAALGEH